jgi:hypothetical protein
MLKKSMKNAIYHLWRGLFFDRIFQNFSILFNDKFMANLSNWFTEFCSCQSAGIFLISFLSLWSLIVIFHSSTLLKDIFNIFLIITAENMLIFGVRLNYYLGILWNINNFCISLCRIGQICLIFSIIVSIF